MNKCALSLFTFQYGEIKSNCQMSPKFCIELFTFQYGEIKSSRIS